MRVRRTLGQFNDNEAYTHVKSIDSKPLGNNLNECFIAYGVVNKFSEVVVVWLSHASGRDV